MPDQAGGLESDPAKTRNTGEFAYVARDERSAVGERRGGDEIVVGANGRPFTLEDGLDVTVMVGGGKVEIDGGNFGGEQSQSFERTRDILTFAGTVGEFGYHDGRQCDAGRWQLIQPADDGRFTLQRGDTDIGIK